MDEFSDQDSVGEPGEDNLGGDPDGSQDSGYDTSIGQHPIHSTPNQRGLTFEALSNTGGSSLKGGSTFGGAKGSTGNKDFVSDFAPSPYDPTGGGAPKQLEQGSPLSARADNELVLQAKALARDRALGFQQKDSMAATPQDDDGFFGLFGGKTKAASDRANFGEFYQAGFAKNINDIENPTAARKGLPFDIAYNVANNPFGRFSSGEEKIAAGIQAAMPFGIGTIIGGLRTYGYMSDKGIGPGAPAQPTDDVTPPPKITRAYKAPKVKTTTASNKTGLNVPTRAQLRNRGPRRAY